MLIQPLFDYACTAWFPHLSKELKLRLQAMQNRGLSFCLQVAKVSRICVKEFLELNWRNVHDRYLQFIVSDIFKFHNNQCPDFFNDVFYPVDDNGVATRCCNKKFKWLFYKFKLGMQSLSYVGPSTWKKLPNNLKTATSRTCFKGGGIVITEKNNKKSGFKIIKNGISIFGRLSKNYFFEFNTCQAFRTLWRFFLKYIKSKNVIISKH